MNEAEIPVKPRRTHRHALTEQEKAYIKSFADPETGTIPFFLYLKALTDIANQKDEV